MKMNKKKIISKFLEIAFLKKRNFPSGCSCNYVKISKTLGVKCYDDYTNRNNTIERQQAGHNIGIAPKPYFKFNFINNFRDDKYYCYVTQHAGKVSESFLDKHEGELCSKLQKIGMDTGDIKLANVGMIKGKLVCIDFDDGSMS